VSSNIAPKKYTFYKNAYLYIMKYTLCIFALCTAFFAVAQTETEKKDHFHPHHELFIGHGFLPVQQLSGQGIHAYDYDNRQASGTIFAGYRYHLTKVVSLGIAAGFGSESGAWKDQRVMYYNGVPATYTYPRTGNVYRSCATIAAEMNFTYGRTRNDMLQFYSGLAAGYTINHQTFTYTGSDDRYLSPGAQKAFFMGHLSLIGIHVGRKLGGFAEFGFGYKGLMNYGFSYKF
jgi:hypothetical protein